MEWIDPRYAETVAAMRRAQAAREELPEEDQTPVRGFIVQEPPAGR